MSVLLVILGLTILIGVTIDVLVTTLTLGAGGPITSRFTAWLWGLALRIHRRNSQHRLLESVGWILLCGITLIWYICMWIGWVCLFNAQTTAVINTESKQPASVCERIYFVGYTLSTLGIGDYQPVGAIWQMATVIASSCGFFLITLSIAYILPIVSAATEKRAFAIYISALGGTPDEILTRAWNGKDFGDLTDHLSSIIPMLIKIGEKHLTYPILHYFHSFERSRSLSLSVVALDEALTLLKYAIPTENQPDRTTLYTVRRASTIFLQTLKSVYLELAKEKPPTLPLELLRNQGIPTVSDREFLSHTQKILQRRQILLALLKNDGWTWDAVGSTLTSNRASNLDD